MVPALRIKLQSEDSERSSSLAACLQSLRDKSFLKLLLLTFLKKFEIKTNVYGFEVFLDQISQFQTKKISTKNAYDANPLQAIERDFAFLFPKNIRAGEIINKIKNSNKIFFNKILPPQTPPINLTPDFSKDY